MADRFISASERGKILGQGMALYSAFMHTSSRQSPEWKAFEEWMETWGTKMAQRVMDTHKANIDWALTHF